MSGISTGLNFPHAADEPKPVGETKSGLFVKQSKTELIQEVRSFLDDSNTPIVLVLNKAIRLATVCSETEWLDLFNAHKKGADASKLKESKLLAQHYEKNPSVLPAVPFWLEALLEDRKRSDGLIHMAPAFEVESTLTEIVGLGVLNPDLYNLKGDLQKILYNIRERILIFTDRMEQYVSSEEGMKYTPPNSQNSVFIGHGNSMVWKDLKDFIQDRLGLPWDEFNRESPAGMATKERLLKMLNDASFAFLIMTAEDEHANHTLHARENVIHEIGLFQGRLGFEKAIILLEAGCKEFSNISGLTQIRFPKGNIKAEFEEIRRVLEREGLLENTQAVRKRGETR